MEEIDFATRLAIRRFSRKVLREEKWRLRELEKQRKFAELTNCMLEDTSINRAIVKMLNILVSILVGAMGATGGAWLTMPFRFKDVKKAALQVILETLLAARIRLQKEDTQ